MGARSPDAPEHKTPKRGKKPAPRDANVQVQIGKVTRSGVAVLGPDELRFNTGRTGREGKDFFLHLRYEHMTELAVDARVGTLTITSSQEETPLPMIFHLGKYSADWKKYIEERPNRLDDLGIKPTTTLDLVGIDDDALVRELEARIPGFAGRDRRAANLDMIFMGIEHKADLRRLADVTARVKRPGGILWIVFPTGSRVVGTLEISTAARPVGLVAAGTLELSRTHTALRLAPLVVES